jgi:hypothetical protein
MNNEWQAPKSKSLKIGSCGFRSFVRGHVGETSPHAYGQAGGLPPLQNNKNNNIIYINRIEGSSVPPGGIA